MSRLIAIAAGVLVSLVAMGGVAWYFAYGIGQVPPARVPLSGLQEPVEIGWHENQLASIRAENEADAYRALGFVHGWRHGWTVTLWRQTAEGRLSVWLDADLLELDRLTRRLGLAELAQAAYRDLPPDDQALLRIYTEGLNAALQQQTVRQRDPFVLLGVEPQPWQPWHPLALERLFAWLSTEPLAPAALSTPAADSFAAADRKLRAWLHLHGFKHSTAWATRDAASAHLFRRIVFGDFALPFLQEVVWLRSDSSYVMGASLPGTLFFPVGQTETQAWAVLLASPTQLTRLPQTHFADQATYQRLLSADNEEHLLRIHRTGEALMLDPFTLDHDTTDAAGRIDTVAAFALSRSNALADTAAVDSALAVQWPGLRPITDWTAWRALLRGEPAGFQLQRGDGLVLTPDGSWHVTGSPRVQARFDQGIIIGNTFWTDYVAERLDTLALRKDSTVQFADWQRDCFSPWAETLAPSLVASVDSVYRSEGTTIFDDALVYLRNWDYAYERASIGASIFETWAHRYHQATDSLPTVPAQPDTSQAARQEDQRRVQLLREAVATLEQAYGEDLSQWRWERVHQLEYAFPVWSADSLFDDGLPAERRYAPLERPGRGHASTPCGGTAPALPESSAPASWEGWTYTNAWPQLTAQRRSFRFTRFLDRYRIPDYLPAPVTFDAFAAPNSTTTLVPSL